MDPSSVKECRSDESDSVSKQIREENLRNDSPMIYEVLESDWTSNPQFYREEVQIHPNQEPVNKGKILSRDIVAKWNQRGLFFGMPTALGYFSGV